MRVIYLSVPVHPEYDSEGMRWSPHLAVYYLGTIMRQQGIEVTIVDPDYIRKSNFFEGSLQEREVIKILIEGKGYDAVIFSATTLTWGIAKRFINTVKEMFPSINVIVGGVHARYLSDYIIQSTMVDIVIPGEGEKTLIKVIQNLHDKNLLKTIQGIKFKLDGEIIDTGDAEKLTIEEMKEFPLPDYDFLPKAVYNTFGVETSRGCKFSCIFCSVCHRHSWRGFDADTATKRVLEHYDNVKNLSLSGEPNIYFVDDCFTADVNRAVNILNQIHQANPYIKVTFEARVTDIIKPGVVEQIPIDMVNMIQIGVECGYNEGLKKIRKGITVEQLEECVEKLSDYDLQYTVSLSFIIGFPWETVEDIKKTVQTMSYLCGTYGVMANLNWLWLMPSDLWWIHKDYGIEVNEDVFDDPAWYADKDVFFKTHPLISVDDVNEITELVMKQQANGARFAYSAPVLR